MDDNKKQIAMNHWLAGAEDALDTAEKLIQVKKYHHALFFGHLYLEKLIKAYFIMVKDDYPIMIHDLAKILRRLDMDLSETQETELDEISTFCVEARYTEAKLALYKKATPGYTSVWMNKIKEYGKWINQLLTQK